MAAWCALNPLALLLEMVSQPDGIGSKPLAIENSQVKRLHRPLWWFALLPGGGVSLVAQRGRQFSRPAQLLERTLRDEPLCHRLR